MIILFSLCNGLANAARGAGVKGGKVIVILMMLITAYSLSGSYIITACYPMPLLWHWWRKGGTGRDMKEIIAALSFLGFGDSTWRFFEFASVFVYSIIYLYAANAIG